jgi:hypothetical protein
VPLGADPGRRLRSASKGSTDRALRRHRRRRTDAKREEEQLDRVRLDAVGVEEEREPQVTDGLVDVPFVRLLW